MYQWQGSETVPHGVLCNEPVSHKKTSWGAPLQRFTGDNAMLHLLLSWTRQTRSELELSQLGDGVRRFDKDYEQWIKVGCCLKVASIESSFTDECNFY